MNVGSALGQACVKPTGDFSYQISDKSVMFTNSVLDATSFKWDFGDGNTSLSNSPRQNYASYGNFNVCLTAFNSCSQAFFCKTIELSAVITGVEEITESRVYSFPNPFNDRFLVSFGKDLPDNFLIINSSGNIVQSFIRTEMSPNMTFDLSKQPSGIYLLNWSRSGKNETTRMVQIH
ncbi:hypothetical protein BH10BAC4_BH10BAC4_22620 [soil metagenome]